VNDKRERKFLLGRDALLQCESAPGLTGEILDTETACEKALSMSQTHAFWGRICKGWQLVFSLIYLYKLYYLFHIL